MASNEVEVLDPATPVEQLKKFASERVLNRRHFIAALGVAGAAAAGTELVRSGPTALAQQPKPSGYAQADVLNFLLNIKYLKATLYSYITQGADLPAADFANLGSGGVFNPPKQITFTAFGSASAQEITDLFNAMYFDELNQLIALRNLIAQGASLTDSAVASRPTMNLLGTGTTTATATTTVTPVQAIATLRMLEDLSASAFAGATIYLTGTNLAYVTQALAVNSFHAGALRLLSIQSGAPYYSPQTLTTTGPTTQSQNSFSGVTIPGSNTVYNFAPTNPIVVGSILSGPTIPVDTVVTAVSPVPVYTGSLTGTTAAPNLLVTNLSNTAGLAVGQVISGSGIPANSVITNITGTTLTLGTVTGYSSVTPPTTPIFNGLTGIAGTGGTGMTVGTYPLVFTGGGGTGAAGTLTVLTPLTFSVTLTSFGSGYVTAPAVSAATGGTPPVLTASVASQITTTANNVVLTIGFLAYIFKGSAVLQYVSPTAGLTPGQLLSGTGVPSASYISPTGGVNVAAATVQMSAVASASSTVTPTGTVTSGSPLITAVSSTSGILPGMPITGTGILAGTLVTGLGVNQAGPTITMSTNATATSTTTSTASPTAYLTAGSNVITALSSLSAFAAGGSVTGTNIPSGTTITSVGAVNTAVMSKNATGTTSLGTAKATPVAILQSGNNIVGNVYPITGTGAPASGQLVIDPQGNIPPGTTITGITASSFTMVLSAPATGATTLTTIGTCTGTVVVSYETITQVTPASIFTGMAVGQTIAGTNIPSGTIITAFSASAATITISSFPTSSAGTEVTASSNPPALFTITAGTTLSAYALQNVGVSSVVGSETVTIPNIETVTYSLGTVTMSNPATGTAAANNTQIVETPDPMDVEPYDPGTAATAASGPQLVPQTAWVSTTAYPAGAIVQYNGVTYVAVAASTNATPSSSPASWQSTTAPAFYQGFFDTAGATTSSANNPAGAIFARTFSQVLADLYGSTAAQTYEGGFFPNGVSGNINNV